MAQEQTRGASLPPFFELPVNNDREAILANIKVNRARDVPSLKHFDGSGWQARPLLIVGGGPSLNDWWHVFKAYRPDCDILALNGAYQFLLGHDIEPEHFMMIDSRPENIRHLASPSRSTTHYLASQVHPSVFDALAGYDVTMFNLLTQTGSEAFADAPDTVWLTAPLGMISVHAIYLGAALGYRTQCLFGYDFSSPGYAYEQPDELGSPKELEVEFRGKHYTTTAALAVTAQHFQRAISYLIDGCQLNVQMCSSGLLPDIIAANATMSVEERETLKYTQCWQFQEYRQHSPGFSGLKDALGVLKPKIGARIADLGCGTGRVVKALEDLGFSSIGIDIAKNAPDEDIEFVCSPLWETLPIVDYALCTDVMEHIPTEKIDDTLRSIFESVDEAVYFDIDTVPDMFGEIIGARLHETVQPAEWWEEKLKAVWPVVESRPDDRQAIFICRRSV